MPLITKSIVINNNAPVGCPPGGTEDQLLAKNSNIHFDYKWVNKCCGPSKIYKALLSQVGTADPTAIILENTTSLTVTYDYTTVGEYIVNITGGILNSSKTIITLGNPQSNNLGNSFYIADLEPSNIQISIKTGLLETDGFTVNPILYDELLVKNLLTIEIYP